ncbi:MAG: hypothetical protein LBI84_08650, partial [Propionibacteriaceae bacterium]|nr:hypothetical protein [Propionibacteriaceae bacterium]
MATWRDGPAYAPRERPFGFAAPADGVSLAPPAALPPAPPPPAEAPESFRAPDGPLPPLSHATVPPPARNPQDAFDVATSTLTSASAWSSVHRQDGGAAGPGPVWAADQPWQSPYAPLTAPAPVPFPAPSAPQPFGPGP